MSIIDRIASQQKWTLTFLALLSAFFFIGLGQFHLFDWDEINFAESAREMIESNDYLRVQINYLPFWEKPPFFFWLQVGAMKLFGVNEYAARFPNALFGAIYLFTFYFIGKRHFSAKFGFIWALVFFASLLPHIYFKSGIIDPVFNFFIFLSVYFMIRVMAKDGSSIWKLALFSGLFSGLSVLTKGPVGFLLLGLTLVVYLIYKRFKVFPSLKGILFFFLGFVGISPAGSQWKFRKTVGQFWSNLSNTKLNCSIRQLRDTNNHSTIISWWSDLAVSPCRCLHFHFSSRKRMQPSSICADGCSAYFGSC